MVFGGILDKNTTFDIFLLCFLIFWTFFQKKEAPWGLLLDFLVNF